MIYFEYMRKYLYICSRIRYIALFIVNKRKMNKMTDAEIMRQLINEHNQRIELLNELSAKIVRPNDSLSATAEVWTRGTSGGGIGDRSDKRGHFHYFSKRGNNGFYITKRYFHVEVAIDNLCHLEIVRTVDKNGQSVNTNGGTWEHLAKERNALCKWLNEPHQKTKLPNWAEILDNWNNENPNNHIKVLYDATKEPFDLDVIPEEQRNDPSVYPQIVFS